MKEIREKEKTRKSKRQKRKGWIILYAVCAMAAFMTELYFMQNYKDMYEIIGAVGVVLIVAVAFLLDEILDMIDERQVGAAKYSMDDLIRIQKAALIQGKAMTEEINGRLEEGTRQVISALGRADREMAEADKMMAKAVVKNNNQHMERAKEEILAAIAEQYPFSNKEKDR